MDRTEAFRLIKESLTATLDREVDITETTDLLAEEILDSLDGVKFVFQLEELAKVRFPDEDLASKGYYQVDRLIRFLTEEAV